jgi:hypothetical protein
VTGSRGRIRKIVTREIGSLIHCLFKGTVKLQLGRYLLVIGG